MVCSLSGRDGAKVGEVNKERMAVSLPGDWPSRLLCIHLECLRQDAECFLLPQSTLKGQTERVPLDLAFLF